MVRSGAPSAAAEDGNACDDGDVRGVWGMPPLAADMADGVVGSGAFTGTSCRNRPAMTTPAQLPPRLAGYGGAGNPRGMAGGFYILDGGSADDGCLAITRHPRTTCGYTRVRNPVRKVAWSPVKSMICDDAPSSLHQALMASICRRVLMS